MIFLDIDIEKGEGKIIDHKGQKLGVYKDEDGKLFAVVPDCTYEGCLLNWDKDAKVWVCPCCGSKYDIEGKVLNGPATEDLAKASL